MTVGIRRLRSSSPVAELSEIRIFISSRQPDAIPPGNLRSAQGNAQVILVDHQTLKSLKL